METDKLRGLGTVRVSKNFLLEKLESKRKAHKSVYKKAVRGWHLQTIATLEEELKKAKADKEYQPSCFITKPTNYIKYYDKTIDLLRASLDKEFVLTSSEFSQYVRDEWSWKDGFMATVSGCLNYGSN